MKAAALAMVGLWLSFALVPACALLASGTGAETVAMGQCEHALAVLRAAKASGRTCAEGKAEAAKAEPGCPLTFECAAKDGGAE